MIGRPTGSGTLALAAALVASTLAACAPGAAAAQTSLRVGVPLEGLLPEAYRRVDVAVPRGPGAVVVTYAAAGGQAPAVAVEVRVADDTTGAEDWVAFRRDTITRALPEAPGLGDAGWGTPALRLFRRANVGVVVRGLAGQDVAALARHVDGHVRAAPAGAPASRRTPLWVVPSRVAQADGVAVALPDRFVAGRLDVTGPGYARATPDGWWITRTGEGPLRITAVGVDRLLRVVADGLRGG